MSFWDTTDGEGVKPEAEYEAPGGSFEAFPDKTDLLAYIDEIKWQENKAEYGGGRYINYRICVTAPECYKGRKSYFKLWVNGDNPNKDADKAAKQGDKDKRMLGAMAVNAGGGLMAIQGEPTDEDLARELTQKMMIFKLGHWSMKRDDGSMGEGNYVMAISPASKGVSETPPKASAKPIAPMSQGSPMGSVPPSLDGDEIPF